MAPPNGRTWTVDQGMLGRRRALQTPANEGNARRAAENRLCAARESSIRANSFIRSAKAAEGTVRKAATRCDDGAHAAHANGPGFFMPVATARPIRSKEKTKRRLLAEKQSIVPHAHGAATTAMAVNKFREGSAYRSCTEVASRPEL